MDAQDFRSLQEAYMEVIMSELDEGYKELPVDKMVAKSKSLARIPREPGAPRWDRNAQRGSDIRKTAGTHSRAKVKKVEKENRERGTQKEQVDIYDIILSHLLDEGYADTEQAAEAIMVNMSEEWRESIVEEVLDEGYKKFPKGKVDKKMANKAIRAVKHQVAATYGNKDKSSENQEKANKLGSQAKKLAQISTEKNKEANSWSRGVQSKHRKEVRDKIKYMDDVAKQQRERGYGK